MNPQYPFHYAQHTPGPPQPQWQAPPRRQGWGDPRPQGHHQHLSGPQSPVSPYQATQLGYQPPPPPPGGPYTPEQANAGQYDTSAWGVKYNQNQQLYQQQEQRPPLPPRPTSAGSHPSPQPEHAAPVSQYQQNYGAAPSAKPQQQTQWTDPYYSQAQPQPQSHDIPPPPPPRPQQYQNQLQANYQQPQFSQDHYSHHPPTHQYEPQSQNVTQQQSSHYPSSSVASIRPRPSFENAPISPIEADAQRWQSRPPTSGSQATHIPVPTSQVDVSQFYASALGTGGPSDWEHFGGPSNTVSPDATSPPPRMEATATPGFDTPMQIKPKPSTDVPGLPTSNATSESPAPMFATPAPVQNNDQPPVVPHRGSDASASRTDGMKRTGTIDSVIQAWNTPLNLPFKAEAQTDQRPGSQGSVPAFAQPPPQERIVEVEKIVEKIVDPYDDLEPEVKASLKRYVAMLRKESAAQTDEEKFATFENFVAKELRLRSMLYGVEAKLQMIKDGAKSALTDKTINHEKMPETSALTPVDKTSQPLVEIKASEVASKPQRAVAPEQVVPQPSQTIMQPQPQPQAEQTMKVAEQQHPVAQPVIAPPQPTSVPEVPKSVAPTPILIAKKDVSPPQSKKDSFVMVNSGDEEPDYSPGGRPKVKNSTQIVTARADLASPPKPQRSEMSPGANAPMVLEDYVMPGLPSPGANAPIILERNSATDLPQRASPKPDAPRMAGSGQSVGLKPSPTPSIKFEPARPAYTPFRYNPTVEAPKLPADQTYSSLRKEAVDSGRLLAQEPPLPPGLIIPPDRASTPSRRAQDEAFIGLIRQQSKAVRKKSPEPTAAGPIPQLRPGTPAAIAAPLQQGGPIPQLRPGTPGRTATPSQQAVPLPKGNDVAGAKAALLQLLPASVPDSYGLSQHPKANSVKATADAISDSFGFIHERVVAWDRQNREVRKEQDEERSNRQADLEQRIDDLFNDNEIGYADIGDLEADFKLAEAEKKYQEDQQELESFTQGVYVPVTERLQKELDDLNAQYTIAIDLLDLESEPASGLLKSSRSKAEMAFVMNCVLSIFNKLELRHQKMAEANVERERRRKRLELTVLYLNGDTAGVKSLEASFAVAEKMQVLHEARGKDTRSNKLMDSFDRATVRGLGDNQTFVDDLLVRIGELKRVVLKDPNKMPENMYDQDGPRDALALAQKAIDFVLADSQKLLTISNVADKLLNDADYSVSVAEAKVSNADASTYTRLASEKEKEDQKIAEDTNSRMASIAKGPEEASGLIREVIDRVGGDPLHKERMKAALEAAKKRNAGKDGADGAVDGGS